MTSQYRGGNSRLLARQLDLLDRPAAYLDAKGQIVFVNAALCELANADATQLVGKQVSWEIPADGTPLHPILTALAPPASVRAGRLAVRQLEVPLGGNYKADCQLFFPLPDAAGDAQLIIAAFGQGSEFEAFSAQHETLALGEQAERLLIDLRRRWSDLDGLHPLVGKSPAIELAMQRAQLAAGSNGNYFVWGPPNIGKSEIARGIFQRRLKLAGLSPISGQFFPLDCSLLDVSLIDGMLEIFAGRLRSEAPYFSQLLVLEHLDELADESLAMLTNWLSGPLAGLCSICGISRQSSHALSQRNDDWAALACRLAVTEIHLPKLRQRREDIAPLIYQKLAEACSKANRKMVSMAPDALDLLTAYEWPRNIRQVAMVIDEALKATNLAPCIQIHHLPIEIRTLTSQLVDQAEIGEQPTAGLRDMEPIRLDDVLQDLERMILRRALKLSPRNRAQVARWLDISRPRLLRRLSQLGLDGESPDPKEPDPREKDLQDKDPRG